MLVIAALCHLVSSCFLLSSDKLKSSAWEKQQQQIYEHADWTLQVSSNISKTSDQMSMKSPNICPDLQRMNSLHFNDHMSFPAASPSGQTLQVYLHFWLEHRKHGCHESSKLFTIGWIWLLGATSWINKTVFDCVCWLVEGITSDVDSVIRTDLDPDWRSLISSDLGLGWRFVVSWDLDSGHMSLVCSDLHPGFSSGLDSCFTSDLGPGCSSVVSTDVDPDSRFLVSSGLKPRSTSPVCSDLDSGFTSNADPRWTSDFDPGVWSNMDPGWRSDLNSDSILWSDLDSGFISNADPRWTSDSDLGVWSNLDPGWRSLFSNLESDLRSDLDSAFQFDLNSGCRILVSFALESDFRSVLCVDVDPDCRFWSRMLSPVRVQSCSEDRLHRHLINYCK